MSDTVNSTSSNPISDQDDSLRIVIKTINSEIYNLLVSPELPVSELKRRVKVSSSLMNMKINKCYNVYYFISYY